MKPATRDVVEVGLKSSVICSAETQVSHAFQATLEPPLHAESTTRILVTTPDGRLVGLVERRRAERALREHEGEGKEDEHD